MVHHGSTATSPYLPMTILHSGHTETPGPYYPVSLRVIQALKVLLEPSIVSDLRLSVRNENLTHRLKIYEPASHDYLCLTRTRLYSK